jgi:hypothetical protein
MHVGWAPFGPGDSVYINIATEWQGVRLRLGRAGDSLTGMGRNWNDTFSNTQTGPIVGGRVPCDAPPPQD